MPFCQTMNLTKQCAWFCLYSVVRTLIISTIVLSIVKLAPGDRFVC